MFKLLRFLGILLIIIFFVPKGLGQDLIVTNGLDSLNVTIIKIHEETIEYSTLINKNVKSIDLRNVVTYSLDFYFKAPNRKTERAYRPSANLITFSGGITHLFAEVSPDLQLSNSEEKKLRNGVTLHSGYQHFPWKHHGLGFHVDYYINNFSIERSNPNGFYFLGSNTLKVNRKYFFIAPSYTHREKVGIFEIQLGSAIGIISFKEEDANDFSRSYEITHTTLGVKLSSSIGLNIFEINKVGIKADVLISALIDPEINTTDRGVTETIVGDNENISTINISLFYCYHW
ncbi:MAG: hypothetical protein JXR10_09865 [Cyclobacteriaceae bacterium]